MPGSSRRPWTRPAKATVFGPFRPRIGMYPAIRQDGEGPRTITKMRSAFGRLNSSRTLTRSGVLSRRASSLCGVVARSLARPPAGLPASADGAAAEPDGPPAGPDGAGVAAAGDGAAAVPAGSD